jgi:hypothetical protein
MAQLHFHRFVVPNATKAVLRGRCGKVMCAEFLDI